MIHLESEPKATVDTEEDELDKSFSFAKENSAALRAVRIAGLSFRHSPISNKQPKK